MKKYLLLPSSMRSRTDGQVHSLSARQLAFCYGIPLEECVVYLEEHERHERYLETDEAKQLIWLAPRPLGNYKMYLKFATEQWERMQTVHASLK